MSHPLVTVTRVAFDGCFMFSIVAVFHNGVEHYRFLKQEIHEGIVSFIAYETTFDDKDKAHAFFVDYVKQAVAFRMIMENC